MATTPGDRCCGGDLLPPETTFYQDAVQLEEGGSQRMRDCSSLGAVIQNQITLMRYHRELMEENQKLRSIIDVLDSKLGVFERRVDVIARVVEKL